MSISRRILLALITPLFSLLLFGLAFNFGLTRTVGEARSVKDVLGDSGIYASVVPSLLKQAGQIDTNVGAIPALDPLIQNAITKSLPATDVQRYSENAIDNIYLWLNGDVGQPNFNIDLSSYKTNFAANLAESVGQRLKSLPPCATGYTAADFDAINATCLPPGFNADIAANTLRDELTSSSGFLDQASVASSDIKGNDPSKSVFQDQLKDAPATFQWSKKSPIILAVLAVLAAIGLVLLRPTLGSGLRHLGTILLAVGVTMLIFAAVFNFVVGDKIIPRIEIENKTMQQSLRRAATDLSKDVGNNYYLFGGIYALLGTISLATSLALARKNGQEVLPETKVEQVQAEPKTKLPKKKP